MDRYNRDDSAVGEDGAEYEEYAEGYERDTIVGFLTQMPYWTVSAVIHLVLIVVAVSIVTSEPAPEEEAIPITVRNPPPPTPYDPRRKRDVKKTPKILKEKSDQKVITKRIDTVTPDIQKGSELNRTNAMTATSINTAMGAGGGAAGAYGHRLGKGTLVAEGGSEGTEEAVRAALEWLVRHQDEDGSWKAVDFMRSSSGDSANKNAKRYPSDRGWEEHDNGVTALAILAFTGYGHTHRYGVYPEYVATLKKAVKYLKSTQLRSHEPTENGRYGGDGAKHWIYNHAIATMAMAELLVMSNDVIGLRQSVTDAVKLILHAQNPGFGWRYQPQGGDNDTSVTGWMVLALKTAKLANLDIPETAYNRSFADALQFFRRVTNTNGKAGYESPGDQGSGLQDEYDGEYPFSKDLSCMTAVSVLCRIFAGERRTEPDIRKGIGILTRQPPLWQEQRGRLKSTINIYYWYYGSYALFRYGGKPWEEWNEAMQKSLLGTQRVGGDEDGSWDPIGEWGIAGGRVYATAIGAMTLEVYYRFRRAQEGQGF